MGSFFKFAGAVAGVVAIAFTVVQVLDLVNRFKCATIKCSWDLFVSDAFSGDIELYIQLFQIASGILVALGLLGPIAGIISAATAATVTGFGAVFALVALGLAAIYIWWSLGEIQKQLDIMRSGLSGQLSNFVRIRDSLYKMDPDLLRDQGTTSTSYATAAGQVAQVSTGRFKQDFLWLRYYFSRLSFAQQNLAVNVQEARVATDNLLKAFLYNSTGNKVFAGYLEGYNSTKAEFTGSQGLPRFTYNATIYGRQTYGSLGFKRHIISWSGSPSDAQRALNGTFAIEPSLDKVIKWGFQPKNESDGTVPFLPIYANATTTGSQQPLPSCGLQQFCFLGQSGSTTFNNDVYGSNSHLVLDKLNRTQSYFVYKYFINDTASTRQCLVQLPFDGCLCVCGGPYDGMQAWIDNFNSKIPIAQAALQKVNDSFEEYQISSNLKRGQVSSLLPISDPGLNRTVEGNTPDGGDVTLDGSRSFDPNDLPLTNYTWTGDFGKATTVSPTIHLTLGTTQVCISQTQRREWRFKMGSRSQSLLKTWFQSSQ